MVVSIKNTQFTFYPAKALDIFNKLYSRDYEIGLFKVDDNFLHPNSGDFLGVYRPATDDYLLFKPLDQCNLIEDAKLLESYLRQWATIKTHDEVFQLFNHMIDHLRYNPLLKKTAFVQRDGTDDSQYNLLGSIMSVNNKLLLGGCCTVDTIDCTPTPWTIGPLGGNDIHIIIGFHKELIKATILIADQKTALLSIKQ